MGNMDPAEIVNLYRIGFYCSLALTVISVLLAVYVFFKKDIKTLLAKKTGIARRQAAREMQQKNEMTDQLNNTGINLEFGNTGDTGNKTPAPGILPRREEGSRMVRKPGVFGRRYRTGEMSVKESAESTVPFVGKPGGLSADHAFKTNRKKLGRTESFQNETSVLQEKQKSFVISERIIVIHTEEMIEI